MHRLGGMKIKKCNPYQDPFGWTLQRLMKRLRSNFNQIWGRFKRWYGFISMFYLSQVLLFYTVKVLGKFYTLGKNWYNSNVQGAEHCIPFEVVYGRPTPLAKFVPGETWVEAIAQDLISRDEALKQLQYHLQKAQNQMAHCANRQKSFSDSIRRLG